MTDTTKLTADDIRSMLVKDYDFNQSFVDKVKGKSKLADLLHDAESKPETPATEDLDDDIDQAVESMLNDMSESLEDNIDYNVVVDDVAESISDNNTNITDTQFQPTKTWNDPDWTEYILSLLYDDEKTRNKPTVDGLRRITGMVLGDILTISSKVIQTPNLENQGRATVTVTVCVDMFNGRVMEVDGTADVYRGNTDETYALHPTATAESRAESRAYRKLLRLKNIITAEEALKPKEEPDVLDTSEVKDSQIDTLEILSDRGNVDLEKFLIDNGTSLESLRKVGYQKAKELCKILNTYIQTGDIPTELKKNES